MNNTNINISISIFGNNFNIKELSNLLNIEPTNSWYKGDIISGYSKKIFRKETSWEYSTGCLEILSLDKAFGKLIKIFSPKINVINKFIKENNLEISISIVVIIENGIIPALFINKEMINFSCKLETNIDIDMYIN